MRSDLSFALPMLYGFALTLARILGVFVFIPIPGNSAGSPVARVVLALACTMALTPAWPEKAAVASTGMFAMWLLAEGCLGIVIGLAVGLIADALLMGAQVLSMPAGFAYASAFDPNSNADSGILLIFAQLISGVMFFTTGLDRQVIYALARSMETLPPGSFVPGPGMALQVIHLGTSMFTVALRLAIPVVALLLLVDLALGILGRLNSHMQIVSLSFPIKMIVSMILLAATLTVVPRLYREQSAQTMEIIAGFVRRM